MESFRNRFRSWNVNRASLLNSFQLYSVLHHLFKNATVDELFLSVLPVPHQNASAQPPKIKATRSLAQFKHVPLPFLSNVWSVKSILGIFLWQLNTDLFISCPLTFVLWYNRIRLQIVVSFLQWLAPWPSHRPAAIKCIVLFWVFKDLCKQKSFYGLPEKFGVINYGFLLQYKRNMQHKSVWFQVLIVDL